MLPTQLHCSQIPKQMLNERSLQEHFKKFGNVQDITLPKKLHMRYALIQYDSHESALSAKENGELLSSNNRLRIQWYKKQEGALLEHERVKQNSSCTVVDGKHKTSINDRLSVKVEEVSLHEQECKEESLTSVQSEYFDALAEESSSAVPRECKEEKDSEVSVEIPPLGGGSVVEKPSRFTEDDFDGLFDLDTEPQTSLWAEKEDLLWKKIEVMPRSEEHKVVSEMFYASQNRQAVLLQKVERVRNKTLSRQFQAQQVKSKLHLANTCSNKPIVRQLFHGTTDEIAKKICQDGFDRNYAGKNATLYGRGVYFATTAAYSHRYTGDEDTETRTMILANVITGEYCKGDPELLSGPPLPDHNDRFYDSVVNNVESPSIFVVFKDASAFPAYVLTYCMKK